MDQNDKCHTQKLKVHSVKENNTIDFHSCLDTNVEIKQAKAKQRAVNQTAHPHINPELPSAHRKAGSKPSHVGPSQNVTS